MENQIEIVDLFVDEKPYSVTGIGVEQKNRLFIDQFDPFYFNKVALILGRSFKRSESKEKKRLVAQTIRLVHGHAVETLFSHIFAAIQSSTCIIGWLQLYKPNDLIRLVRRVGVDQALNESRFLITPFSWRGISTALNLFGHKKPSDGTDPHAQWAAF